MDKTILNVINLFGTILGVNAQFPTELTIYDFGYRINAFGGLRWEQTRPNTSHGNIAHLFQYLSPEMPVKQFPKKQFTVCWNMNLRNFQVGADVIMRLFSSNNTEWSNEPNDDWLQLSYSGSRGSLILRTSEWRENKTRKHIWSGGLGTENTTSDANPFMRWGAFCFAMDTKQCRIRYFIGKLTLKCKSTLDIIIQMES